MIGIVGGMGPYAGLAVTKAVLDEMSVECEQDFLDVVMLSQSSQIADRTAYLQYPQEKENPALGIVKCIEKLEKIGANPIGIACNTAHAPPIWNKIQTTLSQKGIKREIISMIQSVVDYVKELSITQVGLLATKGTYLSKVYQEAFKQQLDIDIIQPDEKKQEQLQEIIYRLKIHGYRMSKLEKNHLQQIWQSLLNQGAQRCILGCTELSTQFWHHEQRELLIDSKVMLAKALIKGKEKPSIF